MKTMIRTALALLMIFTLYTPVNAVASADITSGVDPYSNGKNPSTIVLDNGHMLTLYEGQTSGLLYYRLGEYKDGKTDWYSDEIQFETGNNPNATILDTGEIMSVHENKGLLYYSLGRYENGTINWYSRGNHYGWGYKPDVVTMNGLTTSFYLENGKIVMKYGKYQNGTINWAMTNPTPVSNFVADKFSVDLIDDGKHWLITFDIDRTDSWLNYAVGKTDATQTKPILLNEISEKYSDGRNPSIADLGDGHVINTYEGQTSNYLYYRVGEFKDGKMSWGEQIKYEDKRKNPSVITYGRDIIVSSEDSLQIYDRYGSYNGSGVAWDGLIGSPDHGYASGNNPAITGLNNGLVVAIKDDGGHLSYQIGEYANDKMYWTVPVNYDTGKKPSVTTLPNGEIVEFHEDPTGKYLFYNLGRFDSISRSIDWYSVGNRYSTTVENKTTPSVAVVGKNNPKLALAFNETFFPFSQRLLYNQFSINGSYTSSDGNWGVMNSSGKNPSITPAHKYIPYQGDFYGAYEFHEDGSNVVYQYMSYVGGNLSPNGITHTYDLGKDPVGLQLDNGKILTMFEGNRGDNNPTWHYTGDITGSNTISWSSSSVTEFNGQKNDVIQLNNGLLLNVHEDPNSNKLRYLLGRWEDAQNRVVWWTDDL
ncbi:hypothetical protein [Jeotgalibacillus marinus]|uniref:Uncharacterized protein n=1 Tax=Jeotgalibacillus marinus TaxID=86667 RepID=A0ABV3Q7R8_9BACL